MTLYICTLLRHANCSAYSFFLIESLTRTHIRNEYLHLTASGCGQMYSAPRNYRHLSSHGYEANFIQGNDGAAFTMDPGDWPFTAIDKQRYMPTAMNEIQRALVTPDGNLGAPKKSS